MDILAARKKAAEQSRKRAETVITPPAVAEAQPETVPAPPPEPSALSPIAIPQEAAGTRQAEVVPAGPERETAAPEGDERFVDAFPAEDEAVTVEQETETLAVCLGGEDYLVPVERVREVLKVREATPVPHAKEHVTGVISLRGTVLPVIDLARRLGTAAGARDDKSRIVVVGLDDEDAGLIVDRVTGVVRYPAGAVEAVPETVEQGSGAEYLTGIVRKEGKLYILLDLEKAAGK